MLALAALMVSCVAELDTTPEVDITTVRCTIPRIDVEEDFATGILDTLTATKATFSNSNFLWSAGDKIGIIPNTGAQIYFEVDNGAGTSTASFDGGDWAMKSTGTFYAYYPLYPDIFLSKDHVSVSYTGQTQSGNNNNLHTGDYWTLYTEGTTAVGNALNFSFNHLTSFFKTYITVPAGTYTKITFSAPSEVFIKDGYFDLSAQTPTIVGTTMTDELCLNLQNVTFADETELTGYLVLAPVDITGVPITVTVYKDGNPAYEYTLTKASPMVAAKTYAFRATSITQLVESATQANALFAAGATSVTITAPLTEDATIVLPNTSEAVSIILPTTASSSTLTVSYPPAAESYPTSLSITGPEGADLNIQTPNSTVTINGTAYGQITSRTADNTCIISAGVAVNVLKVIQGGVQVYGTVSQIDLSEQEDDAIINVSGTVASLLGEDGEEYSPVTGITLNLSSINLSVGNTETLTATVAPVGAYPKVIWTSSDETVATVSSTGVISAVASGSTTISATTISGGHTVSCEINVTGPIIVGGHECVDLGMPSGTLWATMNIGANSQEEAGLSYGWGQTDRSGLLTVSQSVTYGKNTYELKNGGFITDDYILMPEHDIATHLWGEHWRMPTDAEIRELQNNCTWIWIEATEDNGFGGVAGYKVQSNIPGYTNNYIFLPTNAQYKNNSIIGGGQDVGVYWSSTCVSYGSEHSYHLSFKATWRDIVARARYWDFNVRPVITAYLADQSPSFELPVIGNVVIEETGLSTCRISSTLLSNGGVTTECGFYYGTSPSALNNKRIVSGNVISSYSTVIKGLQKNTIYYVKAYAKNKAGEVLSEIGQFSTDGYTGTINGHNWVDIGIRKSHFDSNISPGSIDDKRVVFSTELMPGYYRWGDMKKWQIGYELGRYESGDVWNDPYDCWQWCYRFYITSAKQYDKDGSLVQEMANYLPTSGLPTSDLIGFQGNTTLSSGGVSYGDPATHNWGKGWITPTMDLLAFIVDACSGYPSGNSVNGRPSLTASTEYTSITPYSSYASATSISNSTLGTSITIPYRGYFAQNRFYPWENGIIYDDPGTGKVRDYYYYGTWIMGSTPTNDNGNWRFYALLYKGSEGIIVNMPLHSGVSVLPVAELPL